MEKFTYEQLMQSLQRAREGAPKNVGQTLINEASVDLHLQELDLWKTKVIPDQSMGERLDIKLESFPAVEELEEDEIKSIVDMIVEVWSQYRCMANLPKGLPYRIAYNTLLSVWDEPVMIFSASHFYFDYYDQDLDQYIKQ